MSLNQSQRHRVLLYGFAVFVVALALLCGSCHNSQPILTTVHDSTHTETITHYRDTVLVVRGDAAGTNIDTSLNGVRTLLEQLSHQVRTIRGERNASLVLSNNGGQLHVEARCDSVQLRLDSAIKVINTMTMRTKDTVQQIPVNDTHAMPGWAKGTALVCGSIAVLLFAILLFFNKVIKR